jgi:hypothetical protein
LVLTDRDKSPQSQEYRFARLSLQSLHWPRQFYGRERFSAAATFYKVVPKGVQAASKPRQRTVVQYIMGFMRLCRLPGLLRFTDKVVILSLRQGAPAHQRKVTERKA